ncbi:MAG: hypothetical protein ACXVW8_05120 [Nocardioidaceae bacterium]
MSWLPEPVQQVTGMFLSLVDEAAPGLVEGLYLHGSLGFGEWYDGRSDVDFVAVTAARPDASGVRLLRDVHARLNDTFPRPPFDGLHVTWDDLAASPLDCPDVPCTLAGEWADAGRVDLNPVTWHELAGHGVHVRGPRLRDVAIWTDQRTLRAYTHANLASYWRQQAEELRRFPDEAAEPGHVAWMVLGVTRLHHLLAKGELTSKSGAGEYVVEAFGERWRLLAAEALAYRVTGEMLGVLTPEQRGAAVVEFAALAVEAGLALEP